MVVVVLGEDVTVVYLAGPAASSICWQPVEAEAVAGLVDRKRFDDLEPVNLRLIGELGDVPTFSWIEGIEGAYVIKLNRDNPGTEFFSYEAGRVLDLAGDATGYSLVVPIMVEAIDEADPDEDPFAFIRDMVSANLFRSFPHPNKIFCGETEFADGDLVTDLEDYNNMDFRIWVELTGATGVELSEIWRSDRAST